MDKKNIKNLNDCNIEQIGFKLVCYACHGTFYDLNKPDPICPYCQNLYSKTMKQQKKTSNTLAAEKAIDIEAETEAEAEIEDVDLEI